jgi:DNA-binding MarR family transcriptional regulator
VLTNPLPKGIEYIAPAGDSAAPEMSVAARIEEMLDEMTLLVRDAAAARPVFYALEVGNSDTQELGIVEATIRMRRERSSQFPADWFSDPAWDILLFLFECHLKGAKSTVGEVGAGTDNRPTTAIRWLDIIEAAGMLDRHRCLTDTRRVFVFLNEKGVSAMRLYFEKVRRSDFSGATGQMN